MKKFLVLIAAFTLTAGAMAQGNGKGKNKQGNKMEKHRRDDGRVYDQNGNNNDRVYRNGGNVNNSGKYTGSAPRKVRDAFSRDYPNASNVSWTKDRGVWTAHFNGGGIFGSGNAVSYRANGQAVGTTNNPVYGRNGERTTQRSGTSVWDKVFRKQ